MVINFFGRRGCGKTTTIKGQLQDCRAPVVIIDILGNYDDPSFIQTDHLPRALYEMKEFYANRNNPNRPKVINLKTSNPTVAADYICAAIWEMHGGTVILDEVDSIHIKMGSCFDEFIRYGRNHNGDLLTGCRRPAELDRNITAAANKFYCFQTHEYRDIEYFQANVFGERAEELQVMPKWSGLFMNYDENMIGKFCIDIHGKIYHTEETRL